MNVTRNSFRHLVAASTALVLLLAATGCGTVPTAPRVDTSAPEMAAAAGDGGGELEILDSPGAGSGGSDSPTVVGEFYTPSLGHPPLKKAKKPKKH